jgi:hypothetical protein
VRSAVPGSHDDLTPRQWLALLGAMAVLCALLLAGCASSRAGSTAEVPCPPAIEAPVLYPGDTWTFRRDDGTRSRHAYDKVTEDGLLRALGTKAKVEYYYDHTHTLRKVYSNGTWLTEPTGEFPDIGYSALAFPLTLGKTWPFTLRDRSFGLPFVGHYRVVGCEQITVPAGSFFAVRLEMNGSVMGSPQMFLQWAEWYAPAVK